MKWKTALVLSVAVLTLAGCGRDPFIHGPFLIGATPTTYYPANCNPGDVRSHEVLNGWEGCMAGEPGTVHPRSHPDSELGQLPPPPPSRTTTSRTRSAWD